MRVPSGDQSGSSSSPGPVRSVRTWEPSGDMTAITLSGPRVRVKAISVPSGDHDGVPSSALLRVRRCALPPAASTTQMSRLSPVIALYAMRVPSGDQDGSKFCPRSEVIAVGSPLGCMVKISNVAGPRGDRETAPATASAAPSGDHAGVTSPGRPTARGTPPSGSTTDGVGGPECEDTY